MTTHTYAILEVSREAFDDVAERLRKAGYHQAFHGDKIDMHGLALTVVPLVADGLLALHENVWVDCIEGFGGPAHVTGVRDEAGSRYKVRMNENPKNEFWAYDGEITRMRRV